MKRFYLILAIAGLVIPYYFFFLFLRENGLNLPLFVQQIFANPVSTFFVVDLFITALAFLAYAYESSRSIYMPGWWFYVLATLLVGPSFAMPLFQWHKAVHIEMLAQAIAEDVEAEAQAIQRPKRKPKKG